MLFACCLLVFGNSSITFAISQNDLQSIVSGTPFYDPTASDCSNAVFVPASQNSGGSNSDLSQNSHVKTAFQFIYSKGYSSAQAAGIVGNLMVESGESIDPHATGDYLKGVDSSRGEPTSFGIAQWHLGRGTDMFSWVTAWSLDNNDPDGKYSFLGQLNYLIYDLEVQHPAIRDAIVKLSTPQDVAAYWDEHFEVSDGKARAKRVSNAQNVFNTAQQQNWTSGIVVKPSTPTDPNFQESNTDSACATPGTLSGTNCASINLENKAINPSENPYVCANKDMMCPTGVDPTTGQPNTDITDAGTDIGFYRGYPYEIRLCSVRGIHVNAFIASAIDGLIYAAAASGRHITGGGFRTMSGPNGQIQTRINNGCPKDDLGPPTAYLGQYYSPDKLAENARLRPSSSCKTDTAPPGFSNHQMGLAVDWSECQGTTCQATLIRDFGGDAYNWFKANAPKFGFADHSHTEAWHWSVDGG